MILVVPFLPLAMTDSKREANFDIPPRLLSFPPRRGPLSFFFRSDSTSFSAGTSSRATKADISTTTATLFPHPLQPFLSASPKFFLLAPSNCSDLLSPFLFHGGRFHFNAVPHLLFPARFSCEPGREVKFFFDRASLLNSYDLPVLF